jgi:hypothetical protein
MANSQQLQSLLTPTGASFETRAALPMNQFFLY